MRNRKFHWWILLTAFVAGLVTLSFGAKKSSGQSQDSNSSTAVKRMALSRRNESSTNAMFAAAAQINANLRTNLTWTFGGKQQRGWYLYDLLIRKTVGTASESDTKEFAEALARWQRESRLKPTGILDEESFMRMVSQWQKNRLRDRTPATADQLTLGSPYEFYDPARAAELRQVERNAYDAFRKMLAAALADPTLDLKKAGGELAPGEKYFKIISSFRSREYQDQLRRKSPNAGSAGLAINSPHFTGRALDIYVGGDPVDTDDANRLIQVNSRVYQWLVKNAERYGFRPYFYEPWHWEYVR